MADSSMEATQELARFLVVLASNFPMGVTGFGDAIIMHIALTLCGLVRARVCSIYQLFFRVSPAHIRYALRSVPASSNRTRHT